MATVDSDKKKVLGRGLASLIPDAVVDGVPPSQMKKDFFLCDIEKIVPSTYQPRKIFEKEPLEELIQSIREHGVLTPLIVRHRGGNFELIAGERRWRAAQKVGIKQVPVIVKEADDGRSLEMALIENIQRQDLNCIEEAIAYQQLVDEFQLSQEDVSRRVGKNRVTVANTMRLLKLPPVIREDITAGHLSMGHARALLALETTEAQLEIREIILRKKLSVRDTERKVSEMAKRVNSAQKQGAPKIVDPNLSALEDELRRRFGVAIKIAGTMTKGVIQFTYASKEGLMRLADELKGDKLAETTGSI